MIEDNERDALSAMREEVMANPEAQAIYEQTLAKAQGATVNEPTPEDSAAAANLARAIEDPAAYWEERCAKAESAYRDVWRWWHEAISEVKRLRAELARRDQQITAVRAGLMTPERHAEIRAYIQRLDLDQLPGWTVEQRIIADLWEALQDDLWEALQDVWDEGAAAGWSAGRLALLGPRPGRGRPANPYCDGPP
jgi:hypothetical protein